MNLSKKCNNCSIKMEFDSKEELENHFKKEIKKRRGSKNYRRESQYTLNDIYDIEEDILLFICPFCSYSHEIKCDLVKETFVETIRK